MNLLMKKEKLTEDEARFYTSSMILSVDSIDILIYIYSDI